MSAQVREKLAIEGGTPVIQRELNRYKGAAVIGDEEKRAVMEVLDSRSLFRYYGPNFLSKVATFEKNFANFVGANYAAAATNGTAALRMGLGAAGIGAGRVGWRLPFMETGLAVSVILGGSVVAGSRWFSRASVVSLAALTGAWHGVAHGMEMPAHAPAGLYSAGLLIGSAAIALAAGCAPTWLPATMRPALPRWAGRGLAAAGAVLLVSSFAS